MQKRKKTMIKGLKELNAFDEAGKACTDALAELTKVTTSLNTGHESKMSTYKTEAARWKAELEAVLKRIAALSLATIHASHDRNG
jgi:hypothetical protein